MKTPTLKQKVEQYENFLHKINACLMSCNHEGVRELVENADNWSYAHRVGNGEHSDRKQQQIINNSFWKLLDTPKANKATEERQRAFTEQAKQKEQTFLT
jgi:hypothetical protein